jgi:hypothetical protein
MIVVYMLAGAVSLYVIISALVKAFGRRPITVQRTQTEEVIVPQMTTVVEVNNSRPAYKKNNLTIEIPNSADASVNPENEFLKEYFKVRNKKTQCFPMLLFGKQGKRITTHARLTIWATIVGVEILVCSLILDQEDLVVSALLACVLGSLVGCILDLVFWAAGDRKSFRKSIRWTLGYATSVVCIIIVFLLGSTVKVDNESQYGLCCCLIIGFELGLFEPLRTVLKAIACLIAKDLGKCVFFEEL